MKLSACAAGAAVVAVLAAGVALPTAPAAPWCTVDALSLYAGAPGSPGDQSQIHFDLLLTNTSSQSCALQGYPGVDLIGPDDPAWGPDYALPQQAGDPQTFTLAPGASAVSRLTFLPNPPGGWVPDAIVLTLPNAVGQLQVPWIPGDISVLRQDAATHPGTYVGPLQPAE